MPIFRKKFQKKGSTSGSSTDTRVLESIEDLQKEANANGKPETITDPKTIEDASPAAQEEAQKKPGAEDVLPTSKPAYGPGKLLHAVKKTVMVQPPTATTGIPARSIKQAWVNPCPHDEHCCTWYEHTVALLVDFFKWECGIFCPFILLFILLTYTFAGAIVMWVMERHYTMYFWDPNYTEQDAMLEALWQDRMTKSKDVWKASVAKTYLTWTRQHHDPDDFMGWSFIEALFYCLGICCASHAAHLEPRTIGGKLFTVIFAVGGIPLYFLVALQFGRLVARAFCIFTKYVLSSCRWLISMYNGSYGKAKPPEIRRPQINKLSCKMAIAMAALYTVIGGMSVIGSVQSSFINLFYYSFITCSCIEIGEIFHHSSILFPFLLFQIGGMAVFSVMFEVIQAELCRRLPCPDEKLCHRLEEQAIFLSEKPPEPVEVTIMVPQDPFASVTSISSSSTPSLTPSSSEQERLAQTRWDVTMKPKKKIVSSSKLPPTTPPPKRRFPTFGFKKKSQDNVKATRDSV